jgi:hypothetical protein
MWSTPAKSAEIKRGCCWEPIGIPNCFTAEFQAESRLAVGEDQDGIYFRKQAGGGGGGGSSAVGAAAGGGGDVHGSVPGGSDRGLALLLQAVVAQRKGRCFRWGSVAPSTMRLRAVKWKKRKAEWEIGMLTKKWKRRQARGRCSHRKLLLTKAELAESEA